MAKKQTLTHRQENGELATRTTARAYTHVLLRKYNVARLVAELEAQLPSRLRNAEQRAREGFEEYSLYLTKKPGDLIPYNKSQGGFRRFADGTLAQYPMPDWMPEHVAKFMAEYGTTKEAWVAHYTEAAKAELAKHIAQVREYSEDWQVISWHGSERTAKPAGHYGAGTSFRVEAINNGTRA